MSWQRADPLKQRHATKKPEAVRIVDLSTGVSAPTNDTSAKGLPCWSKFCHSHPRN
jgi:hypothetical protein